MLLSGNVGDIELKIGLPKAAPKAVAVISHPHPLYGGSLDNKVTYTLARACVLSNVVAIRHNFRGIGQTQGTHDKGLGELQDVLTVIEYAQHQYPDLPLIIAGFSFGAAMSIQAAQQKNADLLLVVAPPIYPALEAIDNLPNASHLFMGEADEVVLVADVQDWLSQQNTYWQEHWFAEAGHFFHGRLVDLRTKLLAVLKLELGG